MWSKRMLDSLMKRIPLMLNTPGEREKWSYDYGVVLKGAELVWKMTGEQKYFDYIYDNLTSFINEDGTIENYKLEIFNIDHVSNGKSLLTLYEETKEERFKIAVDLLRNQLRFHPQTKEGVFWHKLVYPHQVWLDGLYMGAPFYAEYIKKFGSRDEFDHVAIQFIYCAKNAKDTETGLLYHAYDEKREQPWCNKETGLSENFWGRAMGWFVVGLVDTISHFPESHNKIEALKTILVETLSALRNVQSEEGVWYQVLDKGNKKGNYLEASASCMILYAITKAINMHILDDSWVKTASRAYYGIIDEFVLITKEGLANLNKTCMVAGLGGATKRDGSYTYYISEPIIVNDQKGLGAFIMAMAEYEKLAEVMGLQL